MKCSTCDAEIAPGAPACPVCGALKARRCPRCGSPLPPTAKFCPECGKRVHPPAAGPAAAPAGSVGRSPASASAPPAAAAASPVPAAALSSEPPTAALRAAEPPLPPELRQKLESVRADLRGERREVAVLFADLSGFTALSERLDPEEIGLLVNRLLRELSQAVYRYEGYVDKYIGDAVMALFGAPFAHEDDADRAVLAALAMLEAIARHNRTASTPLALRVGINLGEVVAVQLGAEGRLQYTVLGDVVNVASRLEGKAAPNTVLVSEAVYRRVAQRFRAQRLAPLTMKGKAEPVQAYRILGLEQGAAAAGRERSPFVGREAELAEVAGFLARVARGAGGSLLVEGEPGTGKSRLAREALARAGAELLAVKIGFSPVQLPGQRPALAEIFHQLLPEEPAGASAAERALALLGEDAEAHRAGVEGLAGLAEASPGDETLDEDPSVANQKRWAALTALLRAAAADRPVLLLVEDVHWVDEFTQQFLDLLASAIAGRPIGLLLTCRLREPGAWLPAGADRLALAPLDAQAAEALLGALRSELDSRSRRELMRRAQGNPLFLEELARAVRPGEPPGAGAATAVPGTLQGLLVSRIDRLEPPARLLLQMAAVLGSRFPTRLVARMYHLEPQPVAFEDALDALESEGFLEAEVNGEVRHRFHHALVQEAAYGGLLIGIRRILHESAARLGEGHYAGRLEAEAPFFAHHYWEAGLLERALPHLWSAGRLAARRYDLAAAERFLQRAAEALQRHPEVLPEAEQRGRFHETFGDVLLLRGRLDPAESEFRGLEELGASAGRTDWRVRGLERRGRIAWYRGRLDEARALFEQGLTELTGDQGPIAADLHNDLGVVFYYRASAEEAFAHHTRALRLRRRLRDRLGMAKSLSNIGNVLMHCSDDLPGAERHYLRALALSREAGDRQMTASTLKNLGGLRAARGEWREAMDLFRQVTQIQEEIGWSFLGYLTLQDQIVCELSLGRIGDALRHLETCIERGEAFLEPVNRVNLRMILFDAWLACLQDERAERALEEAGRLARELDVTVLDDELSLRAGRGLAARGRWSEAARAFAEAEDAARRLGHPAYERLARAHLRRAEARQGDRHGGDSPAAGGPAPTAALIGYLNADAEAARAPSAETARALAQAGALAERLGEVRLARAAFEREVEVWRGLDEVGREEAARARATAALEALEDALPGELRPAFMVHPRNAPLQRRGSA